MKGGIIEMKITGSDEYQGPRLSRQEQLKRLRRVIDGELTDRQRRMVYGYYVDQKTMAQLGEEFGINKSTVCRTLQRARHTLRHCLKY